MRVLLLLSSICLCAAARAQLLMPIALDTVKEFRSLERALEDPEHVYRLDLSRNKLKEVPEDIRRLKNLNALDLGRNKLKTLPAWLGELRYMQEFRAGHNKFSEVPLVICQWQDLRRLDLSENVLTGLPACMGTLKKLYALDLWSNELADFPEELRGMTALQFMDLRVILFNEEELQHIMDLFPRTRIHFSQPCNCGH